MGTFNPDSAAVLLRNRQGKGGKDIGQGNEKAVNQLIAHHSIIFKPQEKKFWICTDHWGMSTYTCYDLDSVFRLQGDPGSPSIDERELEIDPEYTWFQGGGSSLFHKYKEFLQGFQEAIKEEVPLEEEQEFVDAFISSNPELYIVYSTLGQYFETLGNTEEAIKYYKLALSKEVASVSERDAIQERLESCYDE
jgi:hypothetical protein